MITEQTDAVICLAWETRGQEFADGIRDGFAAAATQQGWPWLKTARLACQLILNPDSMPQDLMKTVTEQWGPVTGPKASQETVRSAMAQMRADLADKAKARQERERAEAAERARQRAEAAKASQPAERGAA